MKTKIVLLAVCLLAFGSINFAQTKKPANSMAVTPDQIVKNLYAGRKSEATNPFAQTKTRALIDKYFSKDFADLIWKTARTSPGFNVDPLYNSQDEEITNFVVGKPRQEAGPDNVFVKATFMNFGKADSVDYELQREAGKNWKIVGIYYTDGEDLASTLRYSLDEEFQKDYDADQTFKGGYMVGAMQCSVEPTLNRMYYRVQCGEEDFKLYAVEGNENETSFIYTDDKGEEKGKFVFKNGEKDGKYFDASGKETKVSRVQ